MNNQNWKKNIALFLSAQTISLFGSSLVQYGIIWYITLSTSSGKMLTISTLCGFLPQIAISLFAGVWLDRYDRKKIIIISDTVIAISTLLLAIAFLSGYKNMILVFAVLIVRSAGTGIQTPAVNSIIPQIVPKEQLMKIGGINSTLSSIMMFLSPAVSGAILSVATLETSLFIDVVTALIGVSITSTIKISSYKGNANDDNPYIKQLQDGFHYIKKNSFIKKLFLYQVTILFLISPSAFLNPLMVSRSYGLEVWRLTATEMTYSLGMVLGGILITSWGGFKKRLDTTFLAGILYGCLMFGLGISPIFILYLFFNTLIGITSPCYNTPITVTIQEKVSPEMQGRVFSLMSIASSCALPAGMIFFGPLADLMKIQLIFVISGIFVVLISLFKLKYSKD